MHSVNNGTARLRFREGGSTASGFNEYSIGMVGNRNAITVNGQGSGEIITILDNTGNLGINDTTPDNALSIKSIGSFEGDANSFYFGSNFTGTGQNYIGSSKHAQRFFLNNASINGYFSYSNTGSPGTAGNAITWQERLRITSDGNVLVGSSVVQAFPNMDDLQLGDGSGNRGMTISSGTSNYGTIAFGDSTDGSGTDRYEGFVEYYHSDNSMRLGTLHTERLRITSAGDLQRPKSLSQEVSTSVSSVSATSCGSFAKATYRSAYVIAQITQGSSYQVGRYLVIHDGTTATTVEESAIATGDMLGTFSGVVSGSNVEFRVTMSSASSATVITKIESIVV